MLAPITPELNLRIYHTESTRALVQSLTQNYTALNPEVRFNSLSNTPANLLARLREGERAYFIANELPPEANLWAAPLAQDGIVMVVHPDNPVRDLSLDDVRRIYVGNVSNWRDLGGNDQRITPYARDKGTDTRTEFERMVLGQRRITPNALLMPTLEALQNRLSQDVSGIAYIAYSQLTDTLTPVSLNGVLPTAQALATSTYPLRSIIYIVGIVPPNEGYSTFISWVQSLEGQRLVSQNYVPLPR